MNEEKIKEVLSDEEFVNRLLAMETPEEVQEALEEKDIDLSIDEIKKLAEMLQKRADGELSDEDLEDVAGGSYLVGVVVACVAWGSFLGGCAIFRRRW